MIWKEIEGYRYRYRICDEGVIQKYDEKKGWIDLKTYFHQRTLYVKFMTNENKQKSISVFRLIDDYFFDGYAKKNGLVMSRKSDIKSDFSIANIYFTTKQKIGKKSGGIGRRKTVFMTYKGEETVYKSVTQAAKKNGLTRNALLRRARKQVLDEKGRHFRYG